MRGPTVESKCSHGERLYGCVVLLWSPSVPVVRDCMDVWSYCGVQVFQVVWMCGPTVESCGERLYGCVVLLWSPSVPVVRDCMDVWSYCGVQVFLW